MKLKIVIKIKLHCEKCRNKALAIAAEVKGVTSVSLEGDDMDRVVVIGVNVNTICLAKRLRKKFQCVTILIVEEVKPPKDKDPPKEPPKPTPTPTPPQCCKCQSPKGECKCVIICIKCQSSKCDGKCGCSKCKSPHCGGQCINICFICQSPKCSGQCSPPPRCSGQCSTSCSGQFSTLPLPPPPKCPPWCTCPRCYILYCPPPCTYGVGYEWNTGNCSIM